LHVQLWLINVGSDYSTVYVNSNDLDCHTISSLPPLNVHSRVMGPPGPYMVLHVVPPVVNSCHITNVH